MFLYFSSIYGKQLQDLLCDRKKRQEDSLSTLRDLKLSASFWRYPRLQLMLSPHYNEAEGNFVRARKIAFKKLNTNVPFEKTLSVLLPYNSQTSLPNS